MPLVGGILGNVAQIVPIVVVMISRDFDPARTTGVKEDKTVYFNPQDVDAFDQDGNRLRVARMSVANRDASSEQFMVANLRTPVTITLDQALNRTSESSESVCLRMPINALPKMRC